MGVLIMSGGLPRVNRSVQLIRAMNRAKAPNCIRAHPQLVDPLTCRTVDVGTAMARVGQLEHRAIREDGA